MESSEITGVPATPFVRKEENVGSLPLSTSEHTVKDLKEVPSTPQGSEVERIKPLSKAIMPETPSFVEKGEVNHAIISVEERTSDEQHVEKARSLVLPLIQQSDESSLKGTSSVNKWVEDDKSYFAQLKGL